MSVIGASESGGHQNSGEEAREGTAIPSTKSKAIPAPKPRREASLPRTEQQRLRKGKVTKTNSRLQPTDSKPGRETTSGHFVAPDRNVDDDIVSRIPRPQEPLNLEKAVKRRTDWTPPKLAIGGPSGDDLSESREAPSSSHPAVESPKRGFKDLFESYGCKTDEHASSKPDLDNINSVWSKRKLLEMVTTLDREAPEPSLAKLSPAKLRPSTKKPRTITELATAAYRSSLVEAAAASIEAEQSGSKTSPGDAARPKEALNNGCQLAAKPRKARGAKQSTRKARSQQLLSPASAIRQGHRQDFVFGTSSQLAREQSPTLLVDLQAAIKASAQVDSDPFASSPGDFTPAVMPKSIPKSIPKLWTAGARDPTGDLVDLKVVELADTAEGSAKSCHGPNIFEMVGCASVSERRAAAENAELRAPSNPSLAERGPASRYFATQPRPADTAAASPTARAQTFGKPTVCIDSDPGPPASNQEQNELVSTSTHSSFPRTQTDTAFRPDYELFTDAQLARVISSYGFKSVKKRTAMIALLNQCWASSSRLDSARSPQGSRTLSVSLTSAASAVEPRPKGHRHNNGDMGDITEDGIPKNGSFSTTQAAPSLEAKKRRPGRPRKTREADTDADSALAPLAATRKRGKTGAKTVVEVPDSESEHRFSSQDACQDISPSPRLIEISVTDDTELSLTLSPTTRQASLFGYITNAVTTESPSRDPRQPSWHERMLMYDPIVLEDFATWLNGGQLDRVGFDGEVSPLDVKKWCESKSVCCLWRVNLRGRERKRF